MKEISLTQGYVTLIDADDYERVIAAGPWWPHMSTRARTVYARHLIGRPGGPQTAQGLHTFLTGWPYIDHRNGNGLDNRRNNLRPATVAQNTANKRIYKNNTSGFKGVSWRPDVRRWIAYIQADGSRRHLGYHKSVENAARAYDTAAREAFGDYAALNFPVAGERAA